jgi:hypothetical protein
MLTRKQNWRRQSSRISRGAKRDYLYEEGLKASLAPQRSVSDPTITGKSSFAITLAKKPWSTWGDFGAKQASEAETSSSKKAPTEGSKLAKRRLRWNTGVRVILIPTRDEYEINGIGDWIWWREQDYIDFKMAAVHELREIMRVKRVDSRTAIALLYQPKSKSSKIMACDTSAGSYVMKRGPFNENMANDETGEGSPTSITRCAEVSPTATQDKRSRFLKTQDSRIINHGKNISRKVRCDSCFDSFEIPVCVLQDADNDRAFTRCSVCSTISKDDEATACETSSSSETVEHEGIVF